MSARLAGHELQYEGAAFDAKGRPLDVWRMRSAGSGRGKCSCGALSPDLPSGNQRKAWHRAHKEEIRAASA